MFLTAEELRDLTGYQKPAMQKKWLAARAWAYEVNAAGHPKVLRALVEKRMGISAAAPAARRQGPNLGAIL